MRLGDRGHEISHVNTLVTANALSKPTGVDLALRAGQHPPDGYPEMHIAGVGQVPRPGVPGQLGQGQAQWHGRVAGRPRRGGAAVRAPAAGCLPALAARTAITLCTSGGTENATASRPARKSSKSLQALTW